MKKHDLRFILEGVAGNSGTRHRYFGLSKKYEIEITSIPRITREQELELARRSRDGDSEAQKLLAYHNLRSVLKIAWEKRGYLFFDNSIVYEDLFNAGAEGLTIAAEKYEPRPETKFISYAVHWTREWVRQEIRHSQRVRIKNLGYHYRLKHYLRHKNNLWLQTGVEPLVDEVADCMGIDLQDAIDLQGTSLASEKPDNIDDYADYGPEGEIEYSYFEDPSWEPVRMSDTDRNTVCERIRNVLSSVDANILVSVCGLENREESAVGVREMAKRIGCTPQRIHQILARARRRLSRDPVIIELAGRNPWKDSRVWTGSSCKVESFIPQVIEKQKEGVIKEAQRQKERITERVRRKKKRKEKKTRLILENELELQTPVHDAPVKVEIRRSKMDETRPSSIDISAFVQTCLAFHGYSGRNPFFPPKAPSWLIPHLRGPIVHLLLERKVELWEMEKVLGEDPPEVLLRERGKVVTALKSNPNYLLPLKLWLMRSLEA